MLKSEPLYVEQSGSLVVQSQVHFAQCKGRRIPSKMKDDKMLHPQLYDIMAQE